MSFFVQIKNSCKEGGIYPTFEEAYFGGCEKFFATKQEAQDYIQTFDDWEQPMLKIVDLSQDEELPF